MHLLGGRDAKRVVLGEWREDRRALLRGFALLARGEVGFQGDPDKPCGGNFGLRIRVSISGLGGRDDSIAS